MPFHIDVILFHIPLRTEETVPDTVFQTEPIKPAIPFRAPDTVSQTEVQAEDTALPMPVRMFPTVSFALLNVSTAPDFIFSHAPDRKSVIELQTLTANSLTSDQWLYSTTPTATNAPIARITSPIGLVRKANAAPSADVTVAATPATAVHAPVAAVNTPDAAAAIPDATLMAPIATVCAAAAAPAATPIAPIARVCAPVAIAAAMLAAL